LDWNRPGLTWTATKERRGHWREEGMRGGGGEVSPDGSSLRAFLTGTLVITVNMAGLSTHWRSLELPSPRVEVCPPHTASKQYFVSCCVPSRPAGLTDRPKCLRATTYTHPVASGGYNSDAVRNGGPIPPQRPASRACFELHVMCT